jgi:hypothetical protein
MLRRSLVAALCSALLSVALVACGGGGSDNGVSSKSPSDIASAASGAVSKVNSVHVAGAVANGNSRFTIDLSLVNGKGGTGSMSQGGLSFKIISVNNEVYINGSPTFWRQFGGASAAQLLSGKWLKAPASGQFASLATLTNIRQLFNQLLSTHGKLAKGKTTTVRGQKVIAVNDKSNGGTLYVATTGKPYPIAIVKNGSDGGRVDFDRFNKPVTLTPPANAIDVSKLSSATAK